MVVRPFKRRSPPRVSPKLRRAPGPGPIPPGLLQALDLEIGRRMEGLLAGDYRSVLHGDGSELAQVRPYTTGDDVRQIEWNVTARTGEPHVRVTYADRVLSSWLLLDTSASMVFGTADRRKADVAEGVALAVGHVATRRGNRLGVATFGSADEKVLPPRQGRGALVGLLGALREAEAGDGGGSSLVDALKRLDALARQRSAVVLVSDFRGPADWRPQLMSLASRHDVIAVEVRDPREDALTDVGEIWLVDPESGRQLRVDTRDRGLRDRYARAAEDERGEIRALIASASVRHLVLYTSGDWLRPLAAFLRRRRA